MPVNQSNNQAVRFIKFWLPVLVCMGFIFYASSIPGRDVPLLFPFQDVLFHAVVYAIMAYLFARALKNSYLEFSLLKIICLTIVFGIGYGLSDEFHQMFVPGRYASGFDLFIDGIGSFLGSLFYR